MKLIKKIAASIRGAINPSTWHDNIVMFHNGRCGSSVTGDLLAQHPAICWDGEVFHPEHDSALRHTYYNRPSWYVAVRMTRQRKPVYGFEIKVGLHMDRKLNVEAKQFVRRLRRFGFNRSIILQRKNNLRRMVSGRVAAKTGQWRVQKKENHPDLVQIKLSDLDGLIHHLRKRYEWDHAVLDMLPKDETLLLTYEADVATDPTIAYRKICNFLGLHVAPVDIQLKKINPYPLSEMITNFDSVRRVLEGHPYEWMLYD